MINFNEETFAKAKQAKSVEELLTFAKESGVEMTAEQAQDIFTRLNQKSGELADDELDNVAGGGCYAGEGNLAGHDAQTCNLWVCKRCHNSGKGNSIMGALCFNCSTRVSCVNCNNYFSQTGNPICLPKFKR